MARQKALEAARAKAKADQAARAAAKAAAVAQQQARRAARAAEVARQKAAEAEAAAAAAAPAPSAAAPAISVTFEKAPGDLDNLREVLASADIFSALATSLSQSLGDTLGGALSVRFRSCSGEGVDSAHVCYEALRPFQTRSVVGPALWLFVHVVAHQLDARLGLQAKDKELNIHRLAAWLVMSRVGSSDVAKRADALLARGALSSLGVMLSREPNPLAEVAFWRVHGVTAAHLRDYLCWSHGAAPKPFVIGKAGVSKKTAPRCGDRFAAMGREVSDRMVHHVRGPK